MRSVFSRLQSAPNFSGVCCPGALWSAVDRLKKLLPALRDTEFGWPRIAAYLRMRAGIYYRKSWSQCGEDLILRLLFDLLQMRAPATLTSARIIRGISTTLTLLSQGAAGQRRTGYVVYAGLRRGGRGTSISI